MAFPVEPTEAFYGDGYVSKFVNSGVDAVSEYMARGYMNSDAIVTDKFRLASAGACRLGRQAAAHRDGARRVELRHHDGARASRCPTDYGGHFGSFDGKKRAFVVEGAGGATWFAEYSVLTGLSARSYGRFADFVTRIAAGRVERGLPHALRRCGYRTFTLYPARDAFMSARSFQTTVGIEQFYDSRDDGREGRKSPTRSSTRRSGRDRARA